MTLVHNQHPPTPPFTGVDHQSGLLSIAQYNATCHYPLAEVAYGPSGSALHEGIPLHSARVDSHHGEPVGLGIAYDEFGSASDCFRNGQYHGLSNSQVPFSPPTPRSTDDDSVRRTTRSGQVAVPVTPTHDPEESAEKTMTRVQRTPRVRKPKTGKTEKPKTPKLTAPLSVLTEGSHIKVKDMEEWVNRPAHIRRAEVERRNGYITRPMNSFMLYRSAYADRAKAWCLQNNHQVVSSVAGESWPLEPPEIRDMYNEFAKIERINHQNAHPSYKFSPSKAATSTKKRRSDWSDDEEPSDLDDTEWAPGSNRSRSRRVKGLDHSQGSSFTSTETPYFQQSFGASSSGMGRSSWDATNGGRQMPMPLGLDPYNQYYQTVGYTNEYMHNGYAEDSQNMRRQDTPQSSFNFTSDQALLGLPGGNAEDLLNGMAPFDEAQVDPILLAFGSTGTNIDPTSLQHHGYQNNYSGMLDGRTNYQELDSLLNLGISQDEYRTSGWQPDPAMTPLEPDSEFDKWMGEH